MGILGKIFSVGNKRPRRLAYAVGLYTIGYNIYDMSWATIQHNSRDAHQLTKRYGAKSYVVISGATDSVGTEFANKFGDKGFNLILVDKNQNSVNELRDQLARKHGESKIESIVFDHENANEWQQYEALCNLIQL